MSSTAPAAATATAFASAVLGVAPYVVANKIKNIQEIKNYGQGKLVSCCVLENAMQPTTIGCTRRCTLSLPGYEDKLLRETLVSVTEVASGNGTVTSLSREDDKNASATTPPVGEVRGPHKVLVVLQYLPPTSCEKHRSPFSPEATAAVSSAQTVLSVCEVSNAVNRCYVEAETTITFDHPAAVTGVDDDTRLARRSAEREVVAFWRQYLEALVGALEATVLTEAYPVLQSTLDLEFRRAYEATEEIFCEWAAGTQATLPRQQVLGEMENALLAWSRLLREYQHTKVAAETAKGDVAGTRRIAAETARQLADRTADVENLQQELMHIKDTDARHKEAITMNATITAMRQTLDNQQRARQMLVEKHKREYSSRPGVGEKTGGNGTDSPLPRSLTGGSTGLGPRPRPSTVPSHALPGDNNPNTAETTVAGMEATATASCSSPPKPAFLHASLPFNKSMLGKLFSADGALSDAQAKEVFHALLRLPSESHRAATVPSGDGRKRGEYITAGEMRAVLNSMDHVGLYEDMDGTQEQLSRLRATVQASYASRHSNPDSLSAAGQNPYTAHGFPNANTAAGEAATTEEEGQRPAAWLEDDDDADGNDTTTTTTTAALSTGVSALSKMVARHDAEKEERRLRAMTKLAEDTVARYAFREPGKLYFDEFCLALMHLFK